MQTHPSVRPSYSKAAFTLVELAISVGIALLLVALATPTMLDVLDANRMNRAADIILGRLTEARGMAVTFASDVEVRLYRTSLHPSLDGGSDQSIQTFRLREVESGGVAGAPAPPSFEFVPEGQEEKLPNSIGISTHDEFTTLWKLPGRTETSSDGEREYVAFRYRPDGTTDLPETANWTIALVKQPAADPVTLPKNFIVLQLDPVTGHHTSYRPE